MKWNHNNKLTFEGDPFCCLCTGWSLPIKWSIRDKTLKDCKLIPQEKQLWCVIKMKYKESTSSPTTCDVKHMPTSYPQAIHSYHWNFHFLCLMAHLILHHLDVWCQQKCAGEIYVVVIEPSEILDCVVLLNEWESWHPIIWWYSNPYSILLVMNFSNNKNDLRGLNKAITNLIL